MYYTREAYLRPCSEEHYRGHILEGGLTERGVLHVVSTVDLKWREKSLMQKLDKSNYV